MTPDTSPKTTKTGSTVTDGTSRAGTSNSGRSPRMTRPAATAATTANTVGTTRRNRTERPTSSSAKSAPPIGAVNATASPAPLSDVCITRTSASSRPPRRPVSAPTTEPMCTVGPSRPSTSPDPIAASAPTNLAGMRRRGAGDASPRSTASTCWIPLPAAVGTSRTASAPSAAPVAVTAIGNSHPGTPSPADQSSISTRQRSRWSRHQRKAPPSTPVSRPAMTASRHNRTRPRSARCGEITRGRYPAAGITPAESTAPAPQARRSASAGASGC